MSGYGPKQVEFIDNYDPGNLHGEKDSMSLEYHGTSDMVELKFNDKHWFTIGKGAAIVLRDLLETYLREEEGLPFNPNKNSITNQEIK